MTLAKPAFSTGVEEKLGTVDVYGASSAFETLGAGGFDTPFDPTNLAALLGTGANHSSPIVTDYSELDGMSLDATQLRSNLICAVPEASGMLGGMSGKISASLLSAKGITAQITATVGGVTKLINKADLSSLRGVSDLISKVSGAPFPISLKDSAGLVTISTNILKQSAALGIPKAYAQFSFGMASNLPMLTKITKNLLPTVISTSNVGMLADIANGRIGLRINSLHPGFAASFAASFKLPPNSKVAEILKISAQVTKAFTRIQGSWNKTKSPLRRPKSSTSVSASFSYNNGNTSIRASTDFKRMLKISATSKITPLAVKPRVVRRQTPASLLPEFSEFPVGTTSTAAGNPDGTVTKTFTLPDGRVAIRTISVDQTVATTIYEYPRQGVPAPQPSDASNIYRATPVGMPYNSPTTPLSQTEVMDEITMVPSEFGLTTYGAGAYGINSAEAAGIANRSILMPDGTVCARRDFADESSEHAVIQTSGGQDYDFTGDPFANQAIVTAEDPIAIGYAVNDAIERSGQSSYLNMNAAQCLRTSFPYTDFGDFTEEQLYA